MNRKPFGFAYKTEIGSDKKMYSNQFIQYNYAEKDDFEEITFHIGGKRFSNMSILRANIEGKADAYNAEGNRWVMLKIPGDILAKLDKKVLAIVDLFARPIRNSDDKFIRVKVPSIPAYIDNVRSPFLNLAIINESNSVTRTKCLSYDIGCVFKNGNVVDSLLRSAVKTSIGARLVRKNTLNGIVPVLYMTSIDIVSDNSIIKYGKFDIQEVNKIMPNNFDKVVVSGPATIAWIEGKKVMVKKSECDEYDYEKAMLALMVKSFFGNEARFHRWCRDNMKLINKAVKKDAKASAEKAEKKSKKNTPALKNKVGEQNSYNRWTKEELDFLLANYKNMTNKELGEHLGRSYASVQTQLNRLRLTRKTSPVKDIPAFLDQLDNDDRSHLKKEDNE